MKLLRLFVYPLALASVWWGLSPASRPVVEASPVSTAAAEPVRDDDQEIIARAEMMIRAPDGGTSDKFGWSVAISEDSAIVGAPEAFNGGVGRGAAYVFVRQSGAWSFQQKLSGVVGNFANFGNSVAISGDTVIVGARSTSVNPNRAYVFVRSSGVWTVQQILESGVNDDFFASSLDIFGDTAVIGARAHDIPATNQGTAYIWVRSGTTWTQQAQLVASDGAGGDEFGHSVAISEERAVIGTPNKASGAGAAYVFVRSGVAWTQEQKLLPSDPAANNAFGKNVDIAGDSILIGSPTITGSNGAYVFVREASTNWTQQQKLISSDRQVDDQLGIAVAISGDLAIVSASYHDIAPSPGANKGAAYAFVRCDGVWTQHRKLTASNGAQFDIFGNSVAVSGNSVFVGAPYNRLVAGGSQGTVYVTPTEDLNIPACQTEIEVNLTSDETDADLNDDICDADLGQTGNQCTLRAAIQTANENDGADAITFNIPGGGTQTISPGSALPAASETVTLDGTTQPGYVDKPVVHISGSTPGLTFGLGLTGTGTGSVIRGLAVTGFQNNILAHASASVIESSYIGVTPNGTAAAGQISGVVVGNAAANVIIGGPDVADGNVIGGLTAGVILTQGATNARVINNKIGTSPDGLAELSNEVGVLIDGANDNKIGEPDDGNLISGNTTGIGIKNASSNFVSSNRIGTNAAGTGALANDFGVVLESASDNRIGDLVSADGNLISGNTLFGVVINDDSTNNRVINNSIGTAANGTTPLSNGEVGVFVQDGATANTVEKNVIGGHNLTGTSAGVGFSANAGPNNVVKGNFVGIARVGGTAIPNKFGIVTVADGQIIGAQNEGNIIGHNEKSGIVISTTVPGPNPEVSVNTVHYNLVGTNGTADIGNSEFGILLEGNVSQNTVTKNIVSGNTLFGIGLTDLSHNNFVKENYVGTNAAGDAAVPNGGGVWLRQSRDNEIELNLVSGNSLGILVGTNIGLGPTLTDKYQGSFRVTGGSYTTGNKVFGNVVGLNGARNAAIPGSSVGIAVGENARDNLIGSATGAYNLVSGNMTTIGYGIFLGTLAANPTEDSLPQMNRFQGNVVGLAGNLQTPLPNKVGFVLLAAVNNTIGGATRALGNTIVGATEDGVQITDGSRQNTIENNFIGVLPSSQDRDSLIAGSTGGNARHGIRVAGSGVVNNRVINNIIGNNGGNGVEVECPDAPATVDPQTLIAGNNIGVMLDQTGNLGLNIRNMAAGILIKDTANVQIGDVGANAGNAIGNNLGDGIKMTGKTPAATQASSTRIVNNNIGLITKPSGEPLAAGNALNGINGVDIAGVLVGGDTSEQANRVVANGGAGILLDQAAPTAAQPVSAKVKGNSIGAVVNLTGTLTPNLGNLAGGIVTRNSSKVEIGGANQNESNLIAENVLRGITIEDSTLGSILRNTVIKNQGSGIYLVRTEGMLLKFNEIGVARSFASPLGLGNTGDGIVAEDSENLTIGDSNAGNVIAGNQGDGVKLIQARLTKLQANLIGLYERKSAYHRHGNRNGVVFIDSETCEIGGLDDLRSNIIAANQEYGMLMDDLTQTLTVRNNLVGTVARNIGNRISPEPTDAGTNFGNDLGGVKISTGSNSNLIGGPEPNARNFIANNGGPGVWVNPTAGLGNWVHQNAIYENTGRGIELGAIGHELNDPMDADAGPNNLQNYPNVVSLVLNGQGELIASYKVDSAPQHSTYGTDGLYVEFFEADPMGAGRVLLGTDHYLLADYNNGLPGTRVKNLGAPGPLGLEPGDKLTVSVTDGSGNTSEFASAIDVPIGGGTPTPTPTPSPSPSPSPSASPTPLYTRGDYDGDNKTDTTVWRPTAFAPNLSAFYTQYSGNGSFFGIQFGNTGDVAIAGDFDADNKTDFGVSRFTTADGVDLIYLESSTNTAKFPVWGNTGDVFVSGDYDGDKKTDVMAWRPSDGTWYIVNSSGANGGFTFITHGQNGDKPYAMDTDGDGKANLVYYRPSSGDWVVRNNDGSSTTTNFGLPADIPVPADYDGDNKDDIAVFRDGLWIVKRSSDGQVQFDPFGTTGDIPVPGDYDADNKYDRAVYRAGIWHMLRSTAGYTGVQFGAPTDTPMPKAYIP